MNTCNDSGNGLCCQTRLILIKFCVESLVRDLGELHDLTKAIHDYFDWKTELVLDRELAVDAHEGSAAVYLGDFRNAEGGNFFCDFSGQVAGQVCLTATNLDFFLDPAHIA